LATPKNNLKNNEVKLTKTGRISFSTNDLNVEYPDFLEVQLKSFQDFLQLETTPENRKKRGII